MSQKLAAKLLGIKALLNSHNSVHSTISGVPRTFQGNRVDDATDRRIEHEAIQKWEEKRRVQYKTGHMFQLRMLPVQFVHHVHDKSHQRAKQPQLERTLQ